MLVLLDTTVLIDYLRGRPVVARVAALRQRGDHPCTSPINLEEVARGLRPSEHAAAQRLVSGLRVLPIGEREGWRAGVWRREHASKGVTLSQADCLIGATAVEAAATLVTGNPKDFPMAGLTVEHWPVGA
jgi:predicted nucleic acid-binding protein